MVEAQLCSGQLRTQVKPCPWRSRCRCSGEDTEHRPGWTHRWVGEHGVVVGSAGGKLGQGYVRMFNPGSIG